MEVATYQAATKLHMLRLDAGEDILEGVLNFIAKEGIQDAVLVSGIGTVDQCCMHFVTTITDPTQMEFKKWTDTPLEVASIGGIIANGDPHLHMVVSTTEEAWAGHLEPGCRTLYLCELMFMETPGFDLIRKPKNTDKTHTDFAIKMLMRK